MAIYIINFKGVEHLKSVRKLERNSNVKTKIQIKNNLDYFK